MRSQGWTKNHSHHCHAKACEGCGSCTNTASHRANFQAWKKAVEKQEKIAHTANILDGPVLVHIPVLFLLKLKPSNQERHLVLTSLTEAGPYRRFCVISLISMYEWESRSTTTGGAGVYTHSSLHQTCSSMGPLGNFVKVWPCKITLAARISSDFKKSNANVNSKQPITVAARKVLPQTWFGRLFFGLWQTHTYLA